MEKSVNFRQVIHLHILSTNEHHYFGSLPAMYDQFSRKELGVAMQTLYNQFKGEYYDNGMVVIRKGRLVQKKHQKTDDIVI